VGEKSLFDRITSADLVLGITVFCATNPLTAPPWDQVTAGPRSFTASPHP
jgi:hypothetical protein